MVVLSQTGFILILSGIGVFIFFMFFCCWFEPYKRYKKWNRKRKNRRFNERKDEAMRMRMANRDARKIPDPTRVPDRLRV